MLCRWLSNVHGLKKNQKYLALLFGREVAFGNFAPSRTGTCGRCLRTITQLCSTEYTADGSHGETQLSSAPLGFTNTVQCTPGLTFVLRCLKALVSKSFRSVHSVQCMGLSFEGWPIASGFQYRKNSNGEACPMRGSRTCPYKAQCCDLASAASPSAAP